MSGELYFSIAEKEILTWMTDTMGVPYLEAVNQVVQQKRELAYIHGMRGNTALRRQILKEIQEWNDDLEKEYLEQCGKEKSADQQVERKIYIPD